MESLRVHTQLGLGSLLLDAMVLPFSDGLCHLGFGRGCFRFCIIVGFANAVSLALVKLSLPFEL